MLRLTDGGNVSGNITTTPTDVLTAATGEVIEVTEICFRGTTLTNIVELWLQKADGNDEFVFNRKYLRQFDEQVIIPSIKLAEGDKLKLAGSISQGQYRISKLVFGR